MDADFGRVVVVAWSIFFITVHVFSYTSNPKCPQRRRAYFATSERMDPGQYSSQCSLGDGLRPGPTIGAPPRPRPLPRPLHGVGQNALPLLPNFETFSDEPINRPRATNNLRYEADIDPGEYSDVSEASDAEEGQDAARPALPKRNSSRPLRGESHRVTIDDAQRGSSPSRFSIGDGRSRRNPSRPVHWLNWLLFDTWFTDILGWIISAGCLAAIIVILLHYNGRPLPEWPHEITLNTLTTLFVSLGIAALGVPVSNCLSQLKYIWCVDREVAATDLDSFDKASRGAWGSLLLILSPKVLSVSSLGALISMLVLAANAVTQQTIKYVPQPVVDHAAGPMSIPRATYFGNLDLPSLSAIPGRQQIDINTESALLSGILFGNRTLEPLRPACSTGNCTWPEYTTLGVCASLANITDWITVVCDTQNDSTSCSARLPKVTPINDQAAGFAVQWAGKKYTGDLQTDNITHPFARAHVDSIAFKSVQNNSLADFILLWYSQDPDHNYLAPQAAELNFQYCVQTLESGVRNGRAWTVQRNSYLDFQGEFGAYNGNWTATPPNSHENFSVPGEIMNSFIFYMSEQFNGYYTKRPDGSSEPFPSSGVKAIVYALANPPYNKGLEIFARNLATSLTNNFRERGSSASAVHGVAHYDQVHVQISMQWITLLALIEVLSLVFLICVIVINERKGCRLWKTSNLAVLRALDVHGRPSHMVGLESCSDMQSGAEDIKVVLKGNGRLWKMYARSRRSDVNYVTQQRIVMDKIRV